MFNVKNGMFRACTLILAVLFVFTYIPSGILVSGAEELNTGLEILETEPVLAPELNPISEDSNDEPIAEEAPEEILEEIPEEYSEEVFEEVFEEIADDSEDESVFALNTPFLGEVQKQEGYLNFAATGEQLVSMAGYSESSMIRMTGNATTVTGSHPGIQLVGASGNQAGAAFITVPLAFTTSGTNVSSDSDLGFSIAFKVFLGPSSSPYADGFVFVICKDNTSLGERGGGIGYSGIKNSIGIEYDNYKNGGNVPVPHTGYYTNGVIDFTSGKSLTNIFYNHANYEVYCWVDYDYNAKQLSITYSSEGSIPHNDAKTVTYVYDDIDVPKIIGSNSCHLGFTAATGGCNQQTIVSGIYYCDNFIPPTEAAIDLSGSTTYETHAKSITYYLDGGNSFSAPGGYVEGCEPFTIPQPTRTGYYFMGWSTNTDVSAKVYKNFTIDENTTGDISLYANWSEAPGVIVESGTLDAPEFKTYLEGTINHSTGTNIPANTNFTTTLVKVKDFLGKEITDTSKLITITDASKSIPTSGNSFDATKGSTIQFASGYRYVLEVKSDVEVGQTLDCYSIIVDTTNETTSYRILNENPYHESDVLNTVATGTDVGTPILKFRLGHVHDWKYTKDSKGVLYAYCAASSSDIDPCINYSDGQDLNNARTLKLSLPDSADNWGVIELGNDTVPFITINDGPGETDRTITGTDTEDFSFGGETGCKIKYYRVSETDNQGRYIYTETDTPYTAPNTVGNYKAEVTIGGKTTFVEYELVKTVPTTSEPDPISITFDKEEHVLLATSLDVVVGGPGDKVLYWVDRGDSPVSVYNVPDSEWSETIPTASDAGYYRVYYKVTGTNISDYDYSRSIRYTDAIIARRPIIIDVETVDVNFGMKEQPLTYVISTISSCDIGDAFKRDTTTDLTEAEFKDRITLTRDKGTAPGIYNIYATYTPKTGDNTIDPNYELQIKADTYTINPYIETSSNGKKTPKAYFPYNETVTAYSDDTATDIINPTNSNADKPVFAGWYADSKFTTRWDHHEPVTQNYSLYAKWVEHAYPLEVSVGGKSPDGSVVTVKQGGVVVATGTVVDGVATFGDLPEDTYTIEVVNGYRSANDTVKLTGPKTVASTSDIKINLPNTNLSIEVKVGGNMPNTYAVGLENLENYFAPNGSENAKIVLNVNKISSNNSKYATEIKGLKDYAKSNNMDFVNMDINHYVNGSRRPNILNTIELLEVHVGKLSNGTVTGIYRYHVDESGNVTISELQRLEEDDTPVEGSYKIVGNSIIFYSQYFSVYGIDYDPHTRTGGSSASGKMINSDLRGKVTKVVINGSVLPASNYTVYDSSVLFHPDYIRTLKPGTYTVQLSDGTSTAYGTLVIDDEYTILINPDTSDTGFMRYVALGACAAIGILGLGYMKKKFEQ